MADERARQGAGPFTVWSGGLGGVATATESVSHPCHVGAVPLQLSFSSRSPRRPAVQPFRLESATLCGNELSSAGVKWRGDRRQVAAHYRRRRNGAGNALLVD